VNASFSADFGKTIVLTIQRSQIASVFFCFVFFRAFSVVLNCRSLFNEAAAYLAALCQHPSPFAVHIVTPTRNNQRQKYMRKKKLTFRLRISAVMGRDRRGSFNDIVMIFVTQNNF